MSEQKCDPLAKLLAAFREFYQQVGSTSFVVEMAEISALYERVGNGTDLAIALNDLAQQSGKEAFGELYKKMAMAGRISSAAERRGVIKNTKPLLVVTTVPPRLGEFLICLLVPPDRQQDRLGDFEEKFNTLWLPKFGPRIARIFYITHAIRSAVSFFRIATIAAVLDRLIHALRG
jgi:hypothetical protein